MLDKVRNMLAEQLNISVDKIKPESRVIEDLGADSLDVVEMLMLLEDEFDVTVSDEESVKLSTVADIVKVIESKTKADE